MSTSLNVNGKAVNIPSYQVAPGDVVSVREKSKTQLRIKSALELAAQRGFAPWIEVDEKKMEGTFKSVPDRGEVAQDVNESLVIELYSR